MPKFLAKLHAVLLLQASSHLEPNENAMNTVLHHFAIWQRQTHSAVLRGSKK
jgi:hypothetical protein